MARSADILRSFTITEGPNTLQNRYEYDSDGNVVYAGYAIRGYLSSDDAWVILKYTYSTGLVTLKQTAFDSWDNREDAIYA